MTEKENQEERRENLKEFGELWIPEGNRKNPRGTIVCLTIIGEIEGHMNLASQNKVTKYEHLLPQLAAVRENPELDGVLLLLNTVGGDIEAGLAIAEMIAGLGKPSVSLILGGSHSIGVPLAVSADYSYIVPSASMTIHPVRTSGMVIGVSQTFIYLERIQNSILDFIARHSHVQRDRLRRLMLNTDEMAKDIGTVLMGEEAVREGLIDEVGGLDDAMEKLYALIAEERENSRSE